MQKVFPCSLCRGGILGGGLYLNEESLTYRTGKLTVDARYRNLVLPLGEIRTVVWKRYLPLAEFTMKNGERFTFLIFGKKRFRKYYAQAVSAKAP